MITTVSSKGQIVIPSQLRRKYGLVKGTRVELVEDARSGCLRIKPITPAYVRRLRGFLPGKTGLKALLDDRRQEKAR